MIFGSEKQDFFFAWVDIIEEVMCILWVVRNTLVRVESKLERNFIKFSFPCKILSYPFSTGHDKLIRNPYHCTYSSFAFLQ